MSGEINISSEVILSKIYEMRGQKVMLDRDLAELYEVETRVLKQAVRRNITRFPEDFMFEMTKEEMENWRSQNVMSKEDKKGLRHAPFCFTEQGVTMLSCVLNSPNAINVNIRIIRIFVKLREMILTNKDLLLKVEQIEKALMTQGKDIKLVFDYLNGFMDKQEKPRTKIGFKQKGEK